MMNIRNVLLVIGLALVAGGVVSCGGGGGDSTAPAAAPPPATVVRSASLTGAQEVPPTGATGTGRGAVVVNPTTMEITGGVTFTGLTGAATSAHIHQLDTNIIIGLVQAADGATATIPAGTTLASAQYAELLAGYLYFNVHTAMNPNGEIRGQITGTTGVTAGLATLNGAQETPPNVSTATGRGTIVVDSATGQILIGYATHNVAGANNAHFHTGAPGVAGGVTIPLNLGTNVVTAAQGATMTVQTRSDLAAGLLYFNVHSSNNLCPPAATCAAGEIRGQIAVQ